MADNTPISSILTTIKKLLGLTKDNTSFDLDIITHINTVFGILTQMGVGPAGGFIIKGYDETWDSYINSPDEIRLQPVKTYIYQKVKLMFDPPSNGNMLSALEKSTSELGFYLYTEEGGY